MMQLRFAMIGAVALASVVMLGADAARKQPTGMAKAQGGRLGVPPGGLQTDEAALSDEALFANVRRPIDLDPNAPIAPRTPYAKWRAAGPGSVVAEMGKNAPLTGRVYVKFRDDLLVRAGMTPGPSLQSTRPITTWNRTSGRGLEPQDPIAEARALLAAYSASIEQAVKFPASRLKMLERKARWVSRKEQADLAGLTLVSAPGGDPVAIAEAFNALDCVEFAEVEFRVKQAQDSNCQPLDQSMQKGIAGVGQNVNTCNQANNQQGAPIICTPGPIVMDMSSSLAGPATASVGPNNGFVNCNKPSRFAYYTPQNRATGTDCNTTTWTPDTSAAGIVWDCTDVGCNNLLACNTDSTQYTRGGAPSCQFGCNDTQCASIVAQLQPECTSGETARGWDALCATFANIYCPQQSPGSATPYNGLAQFAGGWSNPDQFSAICFGSLNGANGVAQDPSTLSGNGDPTAILTAPDNNFAYDPCFTMRGPRNFPANPGLTHSIIYTDFSDGRGVRPWALTPEGGNFAAIPPYAFVQTQAPSGTFTNAGCSTLLGAAPVGGQLLTAAPTNPANAANAEYDQAFGSFPFSLSHDCLTTSTIPGCYTTPCCVFVCTQDPSCCESGWDAACVSLAQGGGAICSGQQLNPAIPAFAPANPVSPNFAAAISGSRSTNLQLYTTAAPCATNTQDMINLFTGNNAGTPPPAGYPTLSSLQAQTPGGAVQPAQSLDGSYSFVTCGFGGGGFDLAGVVTQAATVGISAAAAQGSLSRVGLIDFSIIADHEDLVGKIAIEPGVTLVTANFGGTFNPDHGTAVAGILVAADNGIGITGMAPRSNLIFFPAVSASSPQGRLASALVAAGETLQVGDVLCIPLEVGGGNTLATPTANNLLLATVQNLGVTTVLPAGNGGYSTIAPQSGLNNAILVGGVWPGYQIPPVNANGTPSTPTYPVCSSYGRWRGSNYSATVGVGGGIDVSAWATGLCTLGVGSLYRGTPAAGGSANSRSYQQSFEGTSGACAMIAGLVTVLQSCAVGGVGTGVSPERMRQILADQVYVDGVLQTDSLGNPVRFPNDPTSILQCDYSDRTQLAFLPGTASNLPFAIASGDFVPFGTPSYVQANPVGGFPKAISCLRETLFTQYFPGGISFAVDIVTGVPLFGNTFSVANFDGGFLKVGASRRGRGNTGAGFGRPLVYASSGLMTDVQVRAVLPISDPEELFQLVLRAWGRTSTGAAVMSTDSISGQALTLAYVYDGVANRWRYLDFGFVAAANPNLNMPAIDATVTSLGYIPSNLVVRNNNQFCTYFRLVSFAAGIPGPYEMWWDQFLISTTPLANP